MQPTASWPKQGAASSVTNSGCRAVAATEQPALAAAAADLGLDVCRGWAVVPRLAALLWKLLL